MNKLLLCLLLAFCTSCTNNFSTGAFWKDFHKSAIKKEHNDQGPFGGCRDLYWKSDKEVFNTNEVIDFANKNGWEFVDKITIPKDTLINWQELGFYFSYKKDFWQGDNIINFPVEILSNATLLRFKTSFIAVEPGNANETEVNGYVLINDDSNEMSIYHLWGE